MYLKVGLEINLRKRREGVYSIELRYSEPDSEADIRMGPAQKTDIHLDLGQLQFQIFDAKSYSKILTDSFFADEAVRTMFAKARSIAERLNRPLSVRLLIDEDSPELQGVYWELLRDPTDDTPLFLGENIFFSRYLSSTTWRKVQLRIRAKLRALVMVANPEDLGDYQGIASIPVDAEIERARHALGDIPLTVLGVAGERASLNNLISHLRAEKPDILYLVCHGAIKAGLPYLWLEDTDGNTAITSGKELATQIQELSSLPLLVVLASCQSAGHPNEPEFRTALGPRLAQAGIPAIVAMQGNVSQATVAEFMPVFFESLQKNGEVDRAISLARGSVRTRFDFWMPVLFSRLRSGAIFAEPEAAPRAVRFGWQNWAIFASLILFGSITMALLLVPATGRRLRAEIPWLRCVWPLPVEPSHDIKVAVAEFTTPTDLPAGYSEGDIRSQITPYLKKLADSMGNILYCPVEGEEGPSTLADRIGADILVYGEISHEPGSWFVQPRFYVHPDLSGADELSGEEVFGQKIPLLDDLTKHPEVNTIINKQLGKPLENLRIFLDGIILYKTGYYTDAQDKFQQVLQDWPEVEPNNGAPNGIDIVYLWLGNAYYPQNPTSANVSGTDTVGCDNLEPSPQNESIPVDLAVPDETVLSELPEEYRCAWDAFQAGFQGPDSTKRLLLSMGNWWANLPPRILFGSPLSKCEDHDAASGYYLQAISLGTEAQPDPLIGVKAKINLGLTYLLAANDSCPEPLSLYLQARDNFTHASQQASQLETSTEVRNLRAKAAYNLGRTYNYLNEAQEAIRAYSQALEVTGPQYKDGEPSWQYEIRWGSYIQRGFQYIKLAEAGDSKAWESALQDFNVVITASEMALPGDPVYAMDAYDGKAKVLAHLGDADGSAQMCLKFHELMPVEGTMLQAENSWCNR